MKSRRWTRAGDTLEQAGADRGEPAEQRRVLAQDRLLTLGAGGDEAEGHADQLLQALEVAPRLRRQVGLVLGAAGRRAPALDLLVDGFSLGDDVLVLGELREDRSEEHTSELQSRFDLVCRLLLEKKNIKYIPVHR